MTKFSGIIPPLVTPLLNHDQLDLDSVNRVAEHVIEGGVNGLFVLGTTGEGPSLTYQIRYEMVERACEVAADRVPVLVGVTDNSLAESIHLAEHARSSGAAAIVAAAPFYFAVNQEQLISWFTQLADASPLPLLLYNMPSCVRVTLELETVIQLAQHSNIAGIKDSSGDLSFFNSVCGQFRSNDDFVVFMGPEELIPEAVAAGADGGVCGGGNLLPHVYVQMFGAARGGDHDEVKRMKGVVDQMFASVYRDPAGDMNLIPALKFAMNQVGLCSDCVAPPLPGVSSEHTSQIQSRLESLLGIANSNLSVRA